MSKIKNIARSYIRALPFVAGATVVQFLCAVYLADGVNWWALSDWFIWILIAHAAGQRMPLPPSK